MKNNYKQHRQNRLWRIGRSLFQIGNTMNELIGRYRFNGGGGKISGVSGYDKISGQAFAHRELDGIFKIIPFQLQGLADMAPGNRGGGKNLQKPEYGGAGGAFAQIFFGKKKKISNRGCGKVCGDKALFGQVENDRRRGVPGLAVQQNIQRHIGVN